jgi:hypothetical protein
MGMLLTNFFNCSDGIGDFGAVMVTLPPGPFVRVPSISLQVPGAAKREALHSFTGKHIPI